jgi:hypothetical protein
VIFELLIDLQSFHIDFSMTTMAGFANMIPQLFEQLGGRGAGRL